MTNLFILITIMLFFLTSFNAYYLMYFRSKAKFPGKIDKVDNYYKLDAKIEFQKYLILGIITVAGYFGIDKFIDLTKEADKIKSLEMSFNQLETEYKKAQKNLDDLTSKNAQYESLLNNKEIDLMKLDYKIQEATRQIPEANIRILTRQLVESNLRFAGVPLLITNEIDSAALKKEITKSREILKIVGFSTDEIDKIIKESTPIY